MSNKIFHDIEELHSQWSLLDKMSRAAYLKREINRLNQQAYQLGMYLQGKLYISSEERSAAQHLIDMINSVAAEGLKLREDISKDIFKELVNNQRD